MSDVIKTTHLISSNCSIYIQQHKPLLLSLVLPWVSVKQYSQDISGDWIILSLCCWHNSNGLFNLKCTVLQLHPRQMRPTCAQFTLLSRGDGEHTSLSLPSLSFCELCCRSSRCQFERCLPPNIIGFFLDCLPGDWLAVKNSPWLIWGSAGTLFIKPAPPCLQAGLWHSSEGVRSTDNTFVERQHLGCTASPNVSGSLCGTCHDDQGTRLWHVDVVTVPQIVLHVNEVSIRSTVNLKHWWMTSCITFYQSHMWKQWLITGVMGHE